MDIKQTIEINNAGLNFVITVDSDGRASLAHFGTDPWNGRSVGCYANLLEMHCLGQDIDDHHGSRHTKTLPAALLRYQKHDLSSLPDGRLLSVFLAGGGVETELTYRFYNDVPAVGCKTAVKNVSSGDMLLEYITSFCYYGLTRAEEENANWEENILFYLPYNTWHGEAQWQKSTAGALGLSRIDVSTMRRLYVSQSGSWSSGEYLPMGIAENRNNSDALFWQIEHNGSWYWESASLRGQGLYLQVSGPNGSCHQFERRLRPGECFETIPVTAGVAPGGFDGAISALTQWRRKIRRDCPDNRNLPVIFNDYMNCLMGDPSEQRCLPLIDAAAEAGCEYYVMDAGWFSDLPGGDDSWWGSLGRLEEASQRFPRGLRFVMDYVREKGMIPGLWVEIENIGAECDLVKDMPEDWFFSRRGCRVIEHGRYQLDFCNSEVFDYTMRLVEGLIEQYSLGYLKIDYNINAGLGTDRNTQSAGDGLLEHNRAVLRWLDVLLARHPELVIENCASGGMRMDYAMLSRLPIQSTSDQTDYRQFAAIAAMAASAVTPEQGAVWSYPREDGDEEETVFNMVNAMLGRVHQSGFLNRLSEVNFNRVKEGISCYKSFRTDIRESLPFFPLGIVHLSSPWAAFGLQKKDVMYISIWRRCSEKDTLCLSLDILQGRQARAECIYPKDLPVKIEIDSDKGELRVTLPQKYTARLIRVCIL